MTTLVDANKLKSLVVRENTVTMRRLMSAIDRVDKEDAIPVSWLKNRADEYAYGGHDALAKEIYTLISEYREEQ